MENESDLQSPMCRLCLRVYSNEQLVEIFSNGSADEQTIFAAVSIQPLREDPTTRICVHCRHIVSLINTFKIACLQSEVLLKNSSYELESDAWSILNEVDIFQKAAELVERHQQDIDAVSRKYDFDEDVVYDPETSPSQLLPENVALIDDHVEEFIKEEFVAEDQVIEIQYTDSNGEPCLDVVQYRNSDSMTFDNQVKDEIEMESESFDCITTNDDTGSKILAPRRRRGRAKSDSERDNREKVVCVTCGELVSQQGLEGHLNRHLGVQPFACDVEGCEAKLHSKFALQQHRSRHKSTSRFYDCEVCGKRIKGTAYWLIHRKIHTEEPRFSCDICGKKFRRKCKLKVHSTVHSGIAEYPCEICLKFFTVKHNLTAHYRLHMKNGTYPPGFEPSTTLEDAKPKEESS
ncbi:zinc finger protein ZIPIC-like [Ochlerotatus camptorhynchus]|uniref:zinc finger protein ZIPIC-like n=1 Tax=Ochlerotatus camptorhynchus TaxID=644619 RepID=UPI0031D29BB7